MASPFRTGQGYDAHRLTEGRKLILCGVEIPFEKGLLGHSDADVAVHALIDALLGALALGDIGRHFPDSDAAFKDADSVELLTRVLRLPAFASWEIGNIDLTIVAQRPKLAPYIEAMRERMAVALAVEPSSVSVKAKTTEGMGFCGSGEGIEAFAVVALFKRT
jgi:2-C-methyl-D-erythritol 2,4-cyclodiphosphate synthase